MDTRFATSTDSTRITFDVSGAGIPILLLHGGGGSRLEWHETGYSENDKAIESFHQYQEEIPASKVEVKIIDGLNHVQEFDHIEQVLPIILSFIKREE
jgi:pimeloyl-ACP methyl ester carboxylesterase